MRLVNLLPPAVLGALLLLTGCTSAPAAPAHVTLGIQTSPAMALVMVAHDEGFFRDAGADVELKQFTAGKFALEALLGGSLDFSVSGDVPPLLASMQGHQVYIPAQVVRKTVDEVRVVALRDPAASDASAYFGTKRTLATSIGGGPEFFTYELLRKLGADGRTTVVGQKPEDMPAALASRSVDAIAVFDPFAHIAEQRLGSGAATFTDPVYSELYVLESRSNNAASADTAKRLLAGMLKAETFVKQHPDEAKRIVMGYTNLDRTTIDAIWPDFDFHLALTPELRDTWMREADWARATGKAKTDAANPNFSAMLWEKPLHDVAADHISR